MEEIFDNKIARIDSEMTSIYSKEDVIRMINELQARVKEHISTPAITEANELMFQELNSNVKSRLYQYLNNTDLIDYDSAEFEIEYNNQLVLRHIHIDLDSWTDEFDDIMLEEFQSTFGNPIK
jgi:hypothetical protein